MIWTNINSSQIQYLTYSFLQKYYWFIWQWINSNRFPSAILAIIHKILYYLNRAIMQTIITVFNNLKIWIYCIKLSLKIIETAFQICLFEKKNCLWHFGEIFNSFFTRQLISSEQNISIQWKIKIKWMKMSFRFKSKCRGPIAIPTLRHAVVKFCSHWKFEFICFILKFYVYMEFAIEGLR